LSYSLALAIILVRMHPEREFSNDKVRRRFKFYYGEASKRDLSEGQIPYLRNKWASLSEYIGGVISSRSFYTITTSSTTGGAFSGLIVSRVFW